MILLPIVQRELFLATRRRRTYGTRILSAAAAAFAAGLVLMPVQTWQASATAGRSLFSLLAMIGFGFSLLAGIFTTALCLAEEKQNKTLGLLFLTDLRGYDVVLGKLTTVSLNSFQILLSIFPVLAMTLILGGVSHGEFWRMLMALVTTFAFSVSAGILAGALFHSSGRAMAGTFVVLTATIGVLGLLDYLLKKSLAPASLGPIVPGVWQSYQLVWDAQFALPPGGFFQSLGFTWALSAGFVTWASVILPRACEDRVPKPSRNWLTRLWWKSSERENGFRERASLLRKNPVYWLEIRRPSRWMYIWALMVICLSSWLIAFGYLGYSPRRVNFWVFVSLAPALHGVIKVAIAAAACRRLYQRRRNGELEMLLATPLDARKLCDGEIFSLFRQFAAPVALILLVDALFLMVGSEVMFETKEHSLLSTLAVWGMVVMLMMDAFTLCWVGLWEGLSARNEFAALKRTLLHVLVIPWPVFLLTLCLSPVLYLFGTAMEGFGGWLLGAVIWWWVICFMFNFAWYLRARRQLHDTFREHAGSFIVHRPGGMRRRQRVRQRRSFSASASFEGA